jgi:hypothetical protein
VQASVVGIRFASAAHFVIVLGAHEVAPFVVLDLCAAALVLVHVVFILPIVLLVGIVRRQRRE